MNEFEVFIEDINSCGGEQYAKKELIEVETRVKIVSPLWVMPISERRRMYKPKRKNAQRTRMCFNFKARFSSS